MAWTGRTYGGLWGPVVLLTTGMMLGVVLLRVLLREGTADVAGREALTGTRAEWARALR